MGDLSARIQQRKQQLEQQPQQVDNIPVPGNVSINDKLAARRAQLAPPPDPEQESRPFYSLDRLNEEYGQQSSAIRNVFTGEDRQTEQTQSLPEIGDVATGKFSSDLNVAAGLLTTMNPEAQKDIIGQAVPGTSFSEDEKGNTIVTYPNGKQSILNKPGLSMQDATQLTATALSFLPAARGAGLIKSLLGKFMFAGGAAGLTDQAMQRLSQLFGSEQPIDVDQSLIAGGLGAGAELVAPAKAAIQNKAREISFAAKSSEFGRAQPNIEAAKAATEALSTLSPTGERVGLTQPQQTLVPSQSIQARSVGEAPGGSAVAQDTLALQNQQVDNAVKNVVDRISAPEAIERGEVAFQDAAKKVIDVPVQARKDASEGFYQQAFAEDAKVPLGGVRDYLKSKMKTLSPDSKSRSVLSQALKLLKGKTKKITVNGKEQTVTEPLTLEGLHASKIEIDAMIGLEQASKSPNGRLVSELTQAKNKLVEAMKDASDLYKRGNEVFAEMSPAVDAAKKSIVGKSANKDELKNLSELIFDPQRINLDVMRKAKVEIQAVDPQAWDDLVRISIEKRLGKITLSDKELLQNYPALYKKAIFGNAAQEKILMASVDETVRKNLKFLKTMLERAKSSRPGGSDTSAKSAAKEARSVNRFLALLDFTSWTKKVGDVGRQEAQVLRDTAIAKKLFSTDFVPNIDKWIKANPNSPAEARAMAQLLQDKDDK